MAKQSKKERVMVRFTEDQRKLVERAAQLLSVRRAETIDPSTWIREVAVKEAQNQLGEKVA